jgi:hypothetical protein
LTDGVEDAQNARVKATISLSVGLLLVLGTRTALAEVPAGTPPPAAPGAATAPAEPALSPAPAAGPAAPTLNAPSAPTAPARITVGLPQPTIRPINQSIGIGVALTYVSIPLVLLSGAVLGVGYLVDSDGAKVTGWIMTGTSVALFGVGVGFLVAGSEQGPQPQPSAGVGSATRFESSRQAAERPRGLGLVVPVVSGAF